MTDAIFENYAPQRLSIAGAQPHPGKLVQSAAMAAVEPPKPTYTPNLPKQVINKSLLSLAQLEAVVYAGQAHAQTLPNGARIRAAQGQARYWAMPSQCIANGRRA